MLLQFSAEFSRMFETSLLHLPFPDRFDSVGDTEDDSSYGKAKDTETAWVESVH